MGIKKYLFYLIVFCLCSTSNAQQKSDTIFINNQFYVKHVVKYGETIDVISVKHNVSVNKILETNETSTKLYIGQSLFIPIEKKKSENNFIKSDKKFKIALLLPFYKNLNDTLIASFEDKEEAEQIVLGKSKMALEFMQGIDLALDSVSRIGMKINVHVLDTRNDSAKVVEIIKSKVLDTMDLIIGPIYSRNMDLVSKKYGSDKNKILVSPLSKSSEFLKNHTSTYQINTPFKNQSKILSDFIEEKFNSQNIIICYDEAEKGLACSTFMLLALGKIFISNFSLL